jgi:hypothetical protein
MVGWLAGYQERALFQSPLIGMSIALPMQRLLHQQRQPVKTLAHVGVARGQTGGV